MTKEQFSIKVILIFIVITFLIGAAIAEVREIEEKISLVVKEYIVNKVPKWKDKRVEVHFREGDSNLARIDKWGEIDKCEILKLYPNFNPAGRVALPIRFVDKLGKKQIGLITTKIEVYDSVVVAKNRKKKGEDLLALDLEVVEKDIATLDGKYFTDPTQLEGMVANATISRGAILQPWMAKPVPVVSKGGAIYISFYSPHIVVGAPGEALEDGYLNHAVKVKRSGSKKIFEGRLVTSREVEVII